MPFEVLFNREFWDLPLKYLSTIFGAAVAIDSTIEGKRTAKPKASRAGLPGRKES